MKKVLAFVALMMFNSSVFAVPGMITCWFHNGGYVKTPDGMLINGIHASELNRNNNGWMFMFNERKYFVTNATCSVLWDVK
ncbi:hypothetical protein Ah1_00155 [Aeromonas phage Ah1]|uniref:Uncharacterized protein n=1 Tax=Aeromonas phage Ah1 TaxID=2053701 RepID=A0A2H4YFH2_9CAUD|nr:hypothetical protein KNT77_gp155 [Aeromonas phage Ah1]AUE22696.1 hypothetical protein Ah1_00155 [Aeromonas phage Ah1]